ncbi:MAG: hypothetical protein ACK4YP_28795 [Myxococcota bacterium]
MADGNFAQLRSAILLMPADVRLALRRDTGVMGAIRARREESPEEAHVLMAMLLLGGAQWDVDYSGASPANDFTRALAGDGLGSLPVDPGTTMNCWEYVMYADFLAGNVDDRALRDFAWARPGGTGRLEQTGWRDTLRPGSEEPALGDLVTYEGNPRAIPRHVMLYAGGGIVVSHDNAGMNATTTTMDQQRDQQGGVLRSCPVPWRG